MLCVHSLVLSATILMVCSCIALSLLEPGKDALLLGAVQVQHAGLRDSCTADTLTVDFLVKAVNFFFPKFNYD